MNPKETKKIVIVEANGEEVQVSVSKGDQSFKWLALTLQSRLRENQKSVRGAKTDAGCLVTGLLNNDGDLIDPRDLIAEHAIWVDNIWRCKAQTACVFPSDEWGNPIYNDWVAAAYLTRESNFRWTLEMDSWRNRLDAGQAIQDQGQKGSSSLIQIGEAPDIDTAFELDWSNMHWKWLLLLTEVQKAALRAALNERYELMLAIFRHYCGGGELGHRYGMTTAEYEHLLRMALMDNRPVEDAQAESDNANANANTDAEMQAKQEGGAKGRGKEFESAASTSKAEAGTASAPHAPDLLDLAQLQELAQLTYEKTAPRAVHSLPEVVSEVVVQNKYNSTKSHARWVLMSRSHMVQALVCLAVESEYGPTITDAVTRFIDGPLLQLWQRIVGSYTLYRYLDDETFIDTFLSTYQVVKQAFLSFGTTHPHRGPTMTIDKCIWLFKNSLFIGSALEDKEQEGACALAILNTTFTTFANKSGASKTSVKSIEFEEIVFIEFLETLASVALVSEADSGMGVGKKVRLAFNTIIQLQPPADINGSDISAGRK